MASCLLAIAGVAFGVPIGRCAQFPPHSSRAKAMSFFGCVVGSVGSIPGLGWMTGGDATKKEEQDVIDLESQGVILHDIVGYSSHLREKRPEQRYFFLLPGILVSSSVSFDVADIALKDAILEAWRGAKGGHALDIGPNLTVQRVSDKCFRVFIADSHASAAAANLAPTPTSSLATPPAAPAAPAPESEVVVGSDDAQKAEDPPKPSLPELSASEERNSMILTFQSAEVKETWEKALLEERFRQYLPDLVALDENFARAMHAAMWKGLSENKANYEEIRAIYYKCGRKKHSPAPLFMHVYKVFAVIMPKDQMVACVESFLDVLGVLVADVMTRLLFLSWNITHTFLLKFEVYYRQLLLDEETSAKAAAEAKANDAQADDAAAAPVASVALPSTLPSAKSAGDSNIATFLSGLMHSFSGGVKMDPFIIVAFANHIRKKVNAPDYAQNRDALYKIYGYPTSATAASLGSNFFVNWYAGLVSGKDKVGYPIKVTWKQAQLVLEPTKFCGYFYIDYAIENDQVRRARHICAQLPYRMMDRFYAYHVNNGAEDEEEEEDYAAHFVSYLEWDSLQRAYEEFEMKNKGNRRVLKLIKDARDLYSVPICTASHLDLYKMKADEIKGDFIAQLLDGAESETAMHLKGLRMVLGNWMHVSKQQTGIVEVPRKAQLITVLVLSSWLQSQNSFAEGTPSSPLTKTPGPARSYGQSLIGEVTELEDKTLILMIAAGYMSIVHGKAVHILYSTAADLFRDFKRASPFFQAMSIVASMNDFSTGASVVFCLQRDLAYFYRDAVFRGQAPLARTVLLIYDLKDFKVGSNSNSTWRKCNDVLSASFKDSLDQVFAEGNAALLKEVKGEKPEDLAVRTSSLEKAKAALAEFSHMSEGKPLGYMKQGDTFVFVDADGKPNLSKYSLGVECARYKLLGAVPSISSKFYFQSLPHIYNQYEVVFGLEHMGRIVSEGSKFLSSSMGAWTFHVPSDEFQASVDKLLHHEPEPDAAEEADEAGEAEGEDDSEGTTRDSAKTPATLKENTSNNFSPACRSYDDLPMSQLSTGIMMSTLCDRFYAKFPCAAGDSTTPARWPSRPEHKRLLDFLENEALHNADGVQDFANDLKLAKAGQYGVGV